MRLKLLCILLLMGIGVVFAQSQYPLVSIHDIQYIDSVETKGFSNSPLVGDTVRVRGTVMVSPIVDPDTSREPILYIGSRWGTYIQDPSATEWGGMNILQNDTTGANQGTFLDLIDTSDIVELTGVVTAYGQTNELMLLLNPVTPVNIIDKLPKRPDPIQLKVSDLMQDGKGVKSGFKYCDMYVELHNLISADRNTSNGNFNAYNENGDYVQVYQKSRWFRLDKQLPYADYEPPADGTPISAIRGILTVYNDVFEIIPLYPGDIEINLVPPTISNILRDKVQVKTNEPVTVSAQIADGSGHVTDVALHYQIGDQPRVTLPMTKSQTDTTLYTAVIDGVADDSTIVNYFVTADDNLGLTGYTPSDTVRSNYFYQVLNENLKIRDVQYSPFGSGYSSYNGYYVTLTGIVTADTSDIPGYGSTPLRVYMQDGSGPWTGIMIGTRGMKGVDVLKFKRGDKVTLSGRIMENYGVTSIDSLTGYTVVSSGNTLPEVTFLATGDIDEKSSSDVSAEQWESVLVGYKNVTVTNENADGDPGPGSYNFGEILVNDGSGDARVELQDGNHNYNNNWDSTLFNNPANIYVPDSSQFAEIKGVMFYSYSNFKLTPRKNDDFVGFITDVKDNSAPQPVSYALEQNYPNPFNPSTTINYTVPQQGMVTLKIFNILGQNVKTLVNENKTPGTYTVRFNAGDLSSGVYLYSIKAGNYYQVKKMMLLK